MGRSQSKYFNTAQRMDEALIALLVEKDFEFVTVKEICVRAEVSRSTFYLHYRTMGDLLDECTEGVMRRFLSYFDEVGANFAAQIGTDPHENLVTATPEFIVPYLSFVKENLPVFRAYLTRPQTMGTDLVFRRLFQDVIDPVLARFGVPERERRYRAIFYLTGITAVVQEWVKHDCIDDAEYVAELITKCVLPDEKERAQERPSPNNRAANQRSHQFGDREHASKCGVFDL